MELPPSLRCSDIKRSPRQNAETTQLGIHSPEQDHNKRSDSFSSYVSAGESSGLGTFDTLPSKSHVPLAKASESLSHIAHLNGLRALAFLGVVIFHFQHGLQGGFLGVDVFFVLSGYLMTRSLETQLSQGRFTYASFLWRRFWRLYPALLCTMLLTFVSAYAFFPPRLVLQIAKSAEASTAAVSNLLYKEEDGYFGTSSSLKPLLHTWSLSVEWQFYLVWPLILIAMSRFCACARPVWPLTAICVSSFSYGLYIAPSAPRSAFFLLPGRAFEFAVGALLLAAPRVTAPRLGNAMSLSGTVMIVLSFIYLNASHGAPALIALPALFGSLLVIASPSDVTSNSLYTSAPLDYLGKISYSAYLVHWPVFVFFNNLYEYAPPPKSVELTVVVLMMAVSALMYHFVEDEFRTGAKWWRKLVGAGFVVGVLLMSRHANMTKGWDMRPTAFSHLDCKGRALSLYDRDMKLFMQPRRANSTFFIPGTKRVVDYLAVPTSSIRTVEDKGSFAGVLVGDSFGASFTGVLGAMGTQIGKPFLVASHFNCGPFFDDLSFKLEKNDNARVQVCKRQLRGSMLELIRASKAPVVFLAANWPLHSHVLSQGKGLPRQTSRLEESISKLRKMGKKIIIIGMVPGAHYSIEYCIFARGPLAFLKKCPAATRFKTPLVGSKEQQRRMASRLKTRNDIADLLTSSPLLAAGRREKWLSLVDPFKSLCDEGTGECKVFHNGEPLYSDDHHLTRNGSLLLETDFRRAYNELY